MKGQGDVIVANGYENWSSDEAEVPQDKAVSAWPKGIKCGGNQEEDAEDKSDCTSVELEDDDDDDSDDEVQSFLEESPEFRAKVQYQVRIVALMPGFEAAGRKLGLFANFYKQRFGKSLLEKTGFSSAEMICKSMPHVIQRQVLEEKGEVVLVESTKNMRVVAGIRSGLRRIVYNVLKMRPKGLSAQGLDEECSKVMGRSLTTILTDLSYDTPNMECLVRDMADIVSCKQSYGVNKYFLSSQAEDPSLSDGIVIGSPQPILATATCSDADELEESKIRTVPEDEFLQVRFRLVVLLALRSSGVPIDMLQKVYAEMYTESLDPLAVGFTSIRSLVKSCSDIVLLQESVPERVFLRPSDEACRLLCTLKLGLRMNIFSLLLSSYPDGLEPSVLLDQLQASHPDQVMEALSAYGFSTQAFPDTYSAALHMMCYLVHDMMDYIRFGCRDDGTLVLKLRDTGFPVLDFPDYDQEDDEFVKLLTEGEAVTPRVNVSKPLSTNEEEDEAQDESSQHDISAEVLEHELRLLLGSPTYLETGLRAEEFFSVYSSRTGRDLTYSQLKQFVSSKPGILILKGGVVTLVKSPKNLRILSATKSGLRQVLYWSLLKNSGGVWAELVDGWFLDFTGFSLSRVLLRHGYSSGPSDLQPVRDFLDDMADLCISQSDGQRIRFYMLQPDADDLVSKDEKLLGMKLEYDPVRLHSVMLPPCKDANDDDHSEILVDQEVPGTADSSSLENCEDLLNGEEPEYDPPKAYATPLVA